MEFVVENFGMEFNFDGLINFNESAKNLIPPQEYTYMYSCMLPS